MHRDRAVFHWINSIGWLRNWNRHTDLERFRPATKDSYEQLWPSSQSSDV